MRRFGGFSFVSSLGDCGDFGETCGRPSADLGTARLWTGFAMVRVGILIAVLDVELVTTSLPTILAKSRWA
jgi:hypothetical protein